MLGLSSQVTGWGQDAFGGDGQLQARLQEVRSVFKARLQQNSSVNLNVNPL